MLATVVDYLIEGVSGTGKTSVYKELRQRGYHAISASRRCRNPHRLMAGDDVVAGALDWAVPPEP